MSSRLGSFEEQDADASDSASAKRRSVLSSMTSDTLPPSIPVDPETISTSAVITIRHYGKHEKRRIMKNVIMIGLAFMFLFTASASMNNLQSSINAEVGIISKLQFTL